MIRPVLGISLVSQGFFIASFQAVAKDGPILQSRSIVFGDR